MLSSLSTILLTTLTLRTLASPHTLPLLHRRNDLSTPNPPTINTTILSPNGTDLTSSFRTMVYYQPKTVAPSFSLTGRSTLTLLGRPIADCHSPTAAFQHSHCKHTAGITGSLQDYIVYCQEPPRPSPTYTAGYTGTAPRGGAAGSSSQGHDPPALGEEESCMPDEICIDGIHVKRGWPALASCVRKESFEKDDGQGVEGEGGLRRRVARAVVSAVDGTMPLGVRGLKVDAGVSEKKIEEDETAQVQRKTCTDCFELKTQKLAPETDFLKSW